jgi:hypothetical protein
LKAEFSTPDRIDPTGNLNDAELKDLGDDRWPQRCPFKSLSSVDASLPGDTGVMFARRQYCRRHFRDSQINFSLTLGLSATGRPTDAPPCFARRPVGQDQGFPADRDGHVGGTAADNRLFVNAVVYRYRTGVSSMQSMAAP